MAQFNLAVIYMEGASGVKKNPERALSLLESAAKFGLKQVRVTARLQRNISESPGILLNHSVKKSVHCSR